MRPAWSRAAVADRLRIIEHIAQNSPRAALSIDDRINDAVDQLGAFPESGRAGRVRTTRELPVVSTPFLIVYRLDGGDVRILRLLHGAQRWPERGA